MIFFIYKQINVTNNKILTRKYTEKNSYVSTASFDYKKGSVFLISFLVSSWFSSSMSSNCYNKHSDSSQP